MSDHTKLLRINEVVEQTRLSKSTIYQAMAKGKFPLPIKISVLNVAWLASDIDAYIADRIAARDARKRAA